jgi:hypothetical protein
LWHFSYSADSSGVSGKTFKLMGEDLEIQQKTISLDIFSSDNKYSSEDSGDNFTKN